MFGRTAATPIGSVALFLGDLPNWFVNSPPSMVPRSSVLGAAPFLPAPLASVPPTRGHNPSLTAYRLFVKARLRRKNTPEITSLPGFTKKNRLARGVCLFSPLWGSEKKNEQPHAETPRHKGRPAKALCLLCDLGHFASLPESFLGSQRFFHIFSGGRCPPADGRVRGFGWE